MGSPLEPFLANVFRGKVEITGLQDTINGLVFYGQYVDDIFCLADGTTDTEDLVQKFNSAHPSLKFTTEAETDNEIAFHDVVLHRQEVESVHRRVSCGAGCIGRTTRRLGKSVREHMPAWPDSGETRSISSSILAHLIDMDRRVDAKEAFQVVYWTPTGFSKGLRQRILATSEAVAIRLANRMLCCQKTLTQALSLPWPTPTSSDDDMPPQIPNYSDGYSVYSIQEHHSDSFAPSPSSEDQNPPPA
ncbi:hypothetical protein SprV_0100401400 [Sparganum proliferum]